MSILKPISRNNRRFEDVLISIRNEIVNRNLQPGDKLLPEREMSEVLQVSRTSVREALRILEIFDVIQSKPGEGTTLKKPEIAKLLANFYPFLLIPVATSVELLEARIVLEGGIAMFAAKRRTDHDLCQMEEALERMHSDQLQEQIQADLDFHYAMARAAQNNTLSDMVFVISDIVSQNLQSNRVRMYRQPEINEKLYLHHSAILQAIKDGDGQRAKSALEEKLQYSIEVIQELNET